MTPKECNGCEVKNQLVFSHNILGAHLEMIKQKDAVYTVVQAARHCNTQEGNIRLALGACTLASYKYKGKRYITGHAIKEYEKLYGKFIQKKRALR